MGLWALSSAQAWAWAPNSNPSPKPKPTQNWAQCLISSPNQIFIFFLASPPAWLQHDHHLPAATPAGTSQHQPAASTSTSQHQPASKNFWNPLKRQKNSFLLSSLFRTIPEKFSLPVFLGSSPQAKSCSSPTIYALNTVQGQRVAKTKKKKAWNRAQQKTNSKVLKGSFTS